MKILIFIPCFTNGGAEKQAYILANHLNKNTNHDITIWGFPSKNNQDYTQKLNDSEIKYQQLKVWPNLKWEHINKKEFFNIIKNFFDWRKQEKKLIKSLPYEKFDLIISFTFWPCMTSVIMKKYLFTKNIIWSHRGGDDDGGIYYSNFLVNEIKKANPNFIANSNAGLDFIKRIFSKPNESIKIIKNVYSSELLSYEETNNIIKLRKKIILLHIANFYKEKDYITILKAISLLNKNNIHLHIAGYFNSIEDEIKYKELTNKLGISNIVTFHGGLPKNKIQELLSISTIGLLSSKSEGTPNSIMEYMSYGLPIVATSIKGIVDLVSIANRPYLFEVGNDKDAANKISRLINDQELRQKIGEQNKLKLKSNYNIDTITAQWDNLINKINEKTT